LNWIAGGRDSTPSGHVFAKIKPSCGDAGGEQKQLFTEWYPSPVTGGNQIFPAFRFSTIR
jgi:hypothetical protein